MSTMVGLQLRGRPVLVAGGGPVAARRTVALVADGAQVTVVAPALCEDLVDLVSAGAVTWMDRGVREDDLEDVWLVHAATNDSRVNAQLCGWAEQRRLWAVCASDAAAGSARTPATCDRAGLMVGVLSQGSADPLRVAYVRDQLAEYLQSGPVDLRGRRCAPAGEPAAAGPGRVLLGVGP